MRKFLLIILCLSLLSEAYLSLASMPVAVKITGCIVDGYLVSEETDFGTHRYSHKESPYKIKAVDNNFKPVNFSSFEGKKIRVRGDLLPGDQFIIEPESIENLGLCWGKTTSSTKKDFSEKSKLSLKGQEELARQLYETMAKTDKWDTESFIKLYGRVIEEWIYMFMIPYLIQSILSNSGEGCKENNIQVKEIRKC